MGARSSFIAVLAAVTATAFHVGSTHSAEKTGAPAVPAQQPSPTDAQASERDLRNALRFAPGVRANWIVATVPDPSHSNFKLEFDRKIEALQVAAESSGYQFDRFWFPWSADTAVAEASADDSLPGVLIFHEADSTKPTVSLVIFLVSETANSGIQRGQFRKAISCGNSLNPIRTVNDRALRILGPGFSGSFHSLAQLASEYKSEFEELHVRSWTTDLKAQLAFVERLATEGEHVDFKTTKTPSVYSINQFVTFLRDSWHEDGPIALLVEEGTAFGNGLTPQGPSDRRLLLDNSKNKIYTLKFPRNISTLRNAAESDTRLPGDDPSRPQAPRSGLTLSLKEGAQAASDIPVFSKQQTPVSQESVLYGISSLLKTNTAHYVGILASDPLDILYLSRFLRSACPNLRLFTLDSDLLLEHGSDSSDYAGMLAVTNSPLFAMSQLWTGSRDAMHVFPSSNFEATYNAANDLLLHLPDSPTELKTVQADFRDYRDPFYQRSGDRSYPPIWVTVAGRSGFEPIDVLPTEKTPFAAEERTRLEGVRLIPKYRPGWGYALSLMMLVCVFYCFVITWASPCGKRSLAIFSAKAAESNPLPRAFYLFAMGCALCGMTAVWMAAAGIILRAQIWYCPTQDSVRLFLKAALLFTSGAAGMAVSWKLTGFRRNGTTETASLHGLRAHAGHGWKSLEVSMGCSLGIFALLGFSSVIGTPARIQANLVLRHLAIYYYAACFILGATATAAILPLWDALRRSLEGRRWVKQMARTVRMPYFWGTSGVFAITVCVVTYAWMRVFSQADPQDFFAACRALDLTSGVSPLLPATLLLGGLLALAFVQLRRVSFYEDHYPGVPRLKGDAFCPRLGATVREIKKRTRILSFHPAHAAAYLLLALVLMGVFFQRSQQTLENAGLEKFTLCLSIASGCLLALVWIRFLIIWSAFSEFLQQLERHPLRRVFSLLPRGFVWSPVWQGGGKKRTHVAITRSLECLQALRDHEHTCLELRQFIGEKFGILQAQVTRLLQASAARQRVPRMFYRELENNLLLLSEHAASHLERTKWPLGGYELRAELAKREDTKEALRMDRIDYLKAEPETICGELIAYRLLAFINYVLWQLDNLTGYLSLGFLLLVIALNSYSFRSKTIVDWLLMGMFIIMTIGIVAVFAQADRDAILSRITGTEEGKLDRHFFMHLISYGAVPALVLAATHIPSVGQFFFSWVKPALDAIH